MKAISLIMSHPVNYRIMLFCLFVLTKSRKRTEFKREPGFGALTPPFMGYITFMSSNHSEQQFLHLWYEFPRIVGGWNVITIHKYFVNMNCYTIVNHYNNHLLQIWVLERDKGFVQGCKAS